MSLMKGHTIHFFFAFKVVGSTFGDFLAEFLEVKSEGFFAWHVFGGTCGKCGSFAWQVVGGTFG